MLATVAVLLVGARMLRYAELAVLGGTGVATVGLAVISSVRRPRVSVVIRVSPRRVARGEPATLAVALSNLSRRSSPSFVLQLPSGSALARSDQTPPCVSRRGRRATTTGGPIRTGYRKGRGRCAVAGSVGGSDAVPEQMERAGPPESTVVLRVPRLPGCGNRSFELALPTQTRGVLRLGPAEVIRSDPFGLVVRRQHLSAAATLHIRPRARPLAPLASAPSREPDGQTGYGTAGGLEVHTLRRYTAGEDLRLVHWPSSARAGELMIRTHVDPTEPAATVVLDVRPAAYPPGRAGAAAFEEAVDVTAAAVMTCAREAFGVRLVTTAGLRVTGRRRRRDADVLLDELAAVDLDGRATLDVVGTLRRGGLGTLVLVTGGFDRRALAALAAVGHAYGRVVLVRVGPRSTATARAVDRRDSSDRARLRPMPPVRAMRLAGRARLPVRGGHRPDGQGLRTDGRLTVIDVPDAETLVERWPATDRTGWWDATWDGRR
jgi:uncharacterized protein (DUF58 family)